MLSRMGLHVNRAAARCDHDAARRRKPARANTLNFPNRFMVYQHDTPDKYIFAHDVRAESHGSMRVQDPVKYAEILSTSPGRTSSGPRRGSEACSAAPSRTSSSVDADLDSPHLSNRICRRRWQAPDPPRPLRPRQPHADCDKGGARHPRPRTRAEARAGGSQLRRGQLPRTTAGWPTVRARSPRTSRYSPTAGCVTRGRGRPAAPSTAEGPLWRGTPRRLRRSSCERARRT